MSSHQAQLTRIALPLQLEARRILDETRAALESDLNAACRCAQRLAQLLEGTGAAETPNRGGLAPWQLQRVRGHIESHLGEGLPIPSLAALVGLSANHFTRAFRASIGVSPHAFVMRRRVERAKQLMLETDAPLCEIALICGLADQAHLTRLFTRWEVETPAAWRRLNKRPQSPLAAA